MGRTPIFIKGHEDSSRWENLKQARKEFHRRSQPEFSGAFKMVDFQSIFLSRFPFGIGVMAI